MVFFCKGVLDTVKKFGWAPDIIHCHGWMTSLIPFYLKTAYKDEPIFVKSKVVFSVYENTFEKQLSSKFSELAAIHGHLESKEMKAFKDTDIASLYMAGAEYADALVKGSKSIDKKVGEHIGKKLNKKPMLEHIENEEEYLQGYADFYHTILSN